MKDIPTVTADKKCVDEQVTKSIYADRLLLAVKKLIVAKERNGINVFWNEAEEELIQTVMEFSQGRTITVDKLNIMPDVDS